MTRTIDMDDVTDLPSCPFCGAEGVVLKLATIYEDSFSILCGEGCCETSKHETEAEARTAWNTRHRLTAEASNAPNVETDEQGEAMVCLGCGTTKSLAAIRSNGVALSCCPERKMVKVRDALTKDNALVDAAAAVCERASRTYKARNGRTMSIEADDGEACEIVHSDDMHHLRAALKASGQ